MKMYFNAGSGNHGCEAINRATQQMFSERLTLFSTNIEEDLKYKINDILDLEEDKQEKLKKCSIKYVLAAIYCKLTGDEYWLVRMIHKHFFSSIRKNDICFSVGGDNYCYGGQSVLAYYNKAIHAKKGKTVLWGCSVEPDVAASDHIAADLALYDLITARETITYEALKAVNSNRILVADPAFILERKDLPLPNGWVEGKMVGINASPLILSYGDGDLIMGSYQNLIESIINNTDLNVVLIPHVVGKGKDDLTVLNELYGIYKNTGRVVIIDDCDCTVLKGYIARCRFFVGARTHATIAAYSTCVPTLVVGYSVKSRGIARDLFGTEENYVLPVQQLESDGDLWRAFKWIYEREDEIRSHLEKIMPEYSERAYIGRDAVLKMLGK